MRHSNPPAVTGLSAAEIEEHGMAPLLYAQTGNSALRGAAVRAAALEPFRLADLRALLDALCGIDVLITKGTALAYSLYERAELRPRADTDLLIDAAQLDAVRSVFRRLGYDEPLSSGDMEQTMFRRVDAAGVDHVYDVHWATTNAPVFAGVLRFDELLGRSVALPRVHERARTLSAVDALLYACVHRVAHHFYSDLPIWLADIHFLRERMSRGEHERFWALAAEREVVGVYMRSIARANEAFGGGGHDLAPEFLDAATIARREPTRAYLERDPRRLRVLRAELAALRGWRARARKLRQLAFPPAPFLQERFGTRSRLALRGPSG